MHLMDWRRRCPRGLGWRMRHRRPIWSFQRDTSEWVSKFNTDEDFEKFRGIREPLCDVDTKQKSATEGAAKGAAGESECNTYVCN